jgi:dipeptidyl aminopeptidase/acylaminoacyl peptidase
LRFPRSAGFLGNGDCFHTISEIADDPATERTTLWLFENQAGTARRLAHELDDVASPVASPDRGRIAFIGMIEGRPQICVVSVEHNAVEVLTQFAQGVTGPIQWSPDGASIAFTAGPSNRRDPATPFWVTRSIYRFDGLGYLDEAIQEIYVIDVETREVRRLTNDGAVASSPKWSPDGEHLLYLIALAADDEWSWYPHPHVLHVASGARHVILGEAWGILSAVWARDGERIVFIGAPSRDGMPPNLQKYDLWTVEATGGEPMCHTRSLRAGVGSRLLADLPIYDLVSGNCICLSETANAAYVSAQAGTEVGIWRVGLGTDVIAPVVMDPGTHILLDIDEADRLLYLSSTLTKTPDLFVTEGDQQATARRITALNDELLRDIAPPAARWMKVTAPDGLVLDACLMTPEDMAPPHPTVLCIHGGPYRAYGNLFMIDFHILAGAGFAVLFSNFRGSAGYGTEFMQALVGRWGPLGMVDHLATLDCAVELGIADPARLGVYGLSHGGYATCWLLGHTDRFSAGIAENPVTSLTSMYGVCDFPTLMTVEFGALPHEAPDTYTEVSPLTYAAQCATPLLFIVGENDLRCPPCEAEQYYRILKANRCPTAMLRLPNSDHVGSYTGPPVVRGAQNEALVDWFTRYLTPREADR